MKTILLLIALASPMAFGDTLPSDKRKNGPLIQGALAPVQVSLQESSAVFYSNLDSKPFLYGTVVSADGLIITKASELAEVDDYYVRVGSKKYRGPKKVGESAAWDVALVKIEAEDLNAVALGKKPQLAHGTWVVSNGATERRFRRPRPGIVSANKREIPGNLVVLGVALKEEEEKVMVGGVTDKSGAKKAGLKEGDQILEMEGTVIKKREEMIKKLKGKVPGDIVKLKVKRDDKEMDFEVELMARHKFNGGGGTRNDQLSGGEEQQSARRTGFPMVIQHETMLTRHEVGGPVFTLDNEFVGMNIAAANRVEAFAIPAEELGNLVEKLKKGPE